MVMLFTDGGENMSLWILTRSDTNQAVQPQKMAGALKFGI